MEKHARSIEPEQIAANLSDQRSRVIALALARETDRLPGGKLSTEQYVTIVDQVKFTDPLFTKKDDRFVSIANNPSARGVTVAGLRKIIRVLEARGTKQYTPRDTKFMENVFSEVKTITGNDEIVPLDLYRIFSIDPARKFAQNAFSSKTTQATYSIPSIQIKEWPEDWILGEEFWSNWRAASQPQFIGKPTGTGYVQPVSQNPLADSGTTIGKPRR